MGAPVPLETKREFLAVLSETGNVLETCRRTGVNRATAYHWRGDPEFGRMWEDALLIRREAIRDELVTKAMAATGHVVEGPLVGADGEPVLDDDFEPVVVRRLVGYDGQVLRALLSKFLRSEDGAPVTAIQFNNRIENRLPEKPRLVVPPSIDEAVPTEAGNALVV